MAIEAEELEEQATPDVVARTPADGDTVEVSLPEKLEASPPEKPAVAPESTPPPQPQPPPAPAAVAKEVVVESSKPSHEPLPASTKDERKRRKYWRSVAERVTAERDAALSRLGVPIPRTEFRPDPARSEALRKAADEASSVGIVAQLAVREMADHFKDWQQNFFNDLDGYLHRRELRRLEVDLMATHPDYQDVCTKAGVFEACQVGPDGQWKNPAVARSVYFDETGHPRANPIEAGYELARQILSLKTDDGNDDEGAKVLGQTTPVPAAVTPPPAAAVPARAEAVTATAAAAIPSATPPAATSAESLAEAERRGARQVVERVAETSTRQRGISLLRGAGGGPPRVELNDDLRRHIDDWDRRDPVACGKWLDANSRIADWWTNG